MRAIVVVSMFALAMPTACSHATAPDPQAHSKATLVLEEPVAKPGTQTRIGIQFHIDKDWHIYWKNPGDSGEPPQVRWQLPAGLTAGALEWPSPMRLNNSAGTDYGYQGDVVLLSTLNIPATVQPGSNPTVAGDLRWLVCHDVCIPQRTELKGNIRIASVATVDERAHALLNAAAARIPKPLPGSFHLAATSTHDSLQLSFSSRDPASSDRAPGDKIARAVFFPAEPEQVDNAAPQVVANSGGMVRLELKKSDHLRARSRTS